MAQILKNNVSGVLGLALGAAETSMTLLDASNFPTPTGGDFYLLTLIGLNTNGQEATWEVVKVVAKASNTLTIVRAQEGTTAAAWPVATTVQLRLTAGSVATPDVVAAHVGSSGASHAAASTSVAGFMSAADKTKLDGVATNANNYAHPTGDGNLHVPATGTTSSGKVLTAGATAGSLSWVAPLALGSTAGAALGTAAAGTATTAARSDHVHPVQTSVSGNAGTATKLATARTINGVSFDGSANITINATDSTAREASITAGTTAQYWRGDKTWRDLFTDVRAATLTGLSTATSAVVSATDTVLDALGKLQKQVSDNLTTLTSHTGSTSNPHGVTKAQVGLGDVDNTSDANKPVSTAAQTALNLKANIATTVEQTDIGTGPDEIPLNGYLGDMAFQSRKAVVIEPAASATPQQVGSMVFQLTNDTTLVVKVKGSDGTVRSATLTLA